MFADKEVHTVSRSFPSLPFFVVCSPLMVLLPFLFWMAQLSLSIHTLWQELDQEIGLFQNHSQELGRQFAILAAQLDPTKMARLRRNLLNNGAVPTTGADGKDTFPVLSAHNGKDPQLEGKSSFASPAIMSLNVEQTLAVLGSSVSTHCSCSPQSASKCSPGPAGPPGQRGPDGVPGQRGKDGKPGVDAPAFMVHSPMVGCIFCPQGSPGQQGSDGKPGMRGRRGVSGAPGRPGTPGAPGMPGPMGMPGPKGEPGGKGEKAKDGEDGFKVISRRGPRGLPGGYGPPGSEGLPGKKGQPGLTGQKGTPGPTGMAGMPGIAGPVGPAGKPGLDMGDGQYCECPQRMNDINPNSWRGDSELNS